MKNRITAIVLATTLGLTMIPAMSFASETNELYIDSVDQLKMAVDRELSDGTLSRAEKEKILAGTSKRVVSELVYEKLDAAMDMINQRGSSGDMVQLPNGLQSAKYSYDLGDNCQLVVELQDKTELYPMIRAGMPMVTSGSNDVWKDYGNRYFTAVASVKCNIATASFRLENHYTLSSQGIDERQGKAFATWTIGNGLLAAKDPVITDAYARTVGASDVNMYCTFSCKSGSASQDNYKINTKVQYLAHDTSGGRIKGGHLWSLTRI